LADHDHILDPDPDAARPDPDAARPDPAEPARPASRSLRAGVATLAVLLALALAGGGYLLGRGSAAPRDDGADAGFARDMQTHHLQAVELSLILRDKTPDADLRQLTYDIVTGQQHQAGQMYGWLAAWGLPQTPSQAPMVWMNGPGHAHGADEAANLEAMGLATPAELEQLRAAEGEEAERLFLTLMIEHHRGGVAMADAALAHAERPEVRTLAEAVASAQTAEIALLEDLLAERS